MGSPFHVKEIIFFAGVDSFAVTFMETPTKLRNIITINEFIRRQEMEADQATGELSGLLMDLVLASKIVNREVNKAGLVNILGIESTANASGETQMKLDVFANEQFIAALENGGHCLAVASEELDHLLTFDRARQRGAHYIVAMDPLDGSSNIDVNVSIGTIFSVFRVEPGKRVIMEDFFQPGRRMVAAGYILYGSSTMLVFTTGQGVNGFTLDPSIGEYCLSHAEICIPEVGTLYSVNEGNVPEMPPGVVAYLQECKTRHNPAGKVHSARYIGSLVADFHRNLLKGGIYLYPPTQKDPNGKLRLLYECAPLAFVCEQAGGMASDGERSVMDIVPEGLHQRCPLYIGSPRMVQRLLACLHG